MKKLFKINVLGTDYTVYESNDNEDPKLKKFDGYCDFHNGKRIVLGEQYPKHYKRHLLAHELVHAFCYESGLDDQCWARDEEIVDWISIQTFKITKAIKDSIKLLERKPEQCSKPKTETTN